MSEDRKTEIALYGVGVFLTLWAFGCIIKYGFGGG